MKELPDKEPHIANAIIRCLRAWKLRSNPVPMIVTDEDIDQLEAWAKKLHESREASKEHFNAPNMPE